MFGGGGGNMDPRRMKQMMEQMGIDMDELDVEEIRMETADGDTLVFDSSTSVNRINAQGQEMYQVIGEPTTETGDSTETDDSNDHEDTESSDDAEPFTDEDVDLVAERAGTTEDEARAALADSDGDIAAAIMELGE